jgi:hypothetical protein
MSDSAVTAVSPPHPNGVRMAQERAPKREHGLWSTWPSAGADEGFMPLQHASCQPRNWHCSCWFLVRSGARRAGQKRSDRARKTDVATFADRPLTQARVPMLERVRATLRTAAAPDRCRSRDASQQSKRWSRAHRRRRDHEKKESTRVRDVGLGWRRPDGENTQSVTRVRTIGGGTSHRK